MLIFIKKAISLKKKMKSIQNQVNKNNTKIEFFYALSTIIVGILTYHFTQHVANIYYSSVKNQFIILGLMVHIGVIAGINYYFYKFSKKYRFIVENWFGITKRENEKQEFIDDFFQKENIQHIMVELYEIQNKQNNNEIDYNSLNNIIYKFQEACVYQDIEQAFELLIEAFLIHNYPYSDNYLKIFKDKYFNPEEIVNDTKELEYNSFSQHL